MRPVEALLLTARTAAVMGAVFAGVLALLYVSLEIWDVTHEPRLPGFIATPAVVHPAHAPAASG